jgi:hypothetical protein
VAGVVPTGSGTDVVGPAPVVGTTADPDDPDDPDDRPGQRLCGQVDAAQLPDAKREPLVGGADAGVLLVAHPFQLVDATGGCRRPPASVDLRASPAEMVVT